MQHYTDQITNLHFCPNTVTKMAQTADVRHYHPHLRNLTGNRFKHIFLIRYQKNFLQKYKKYEYCVTIISHNITNQLVMPLLTLGSE